MRVHLKIGNVAACTHGAGEWRSADPRAVTCKACRMLMAMWNLRG